MPERVVGGNRIVQTAGRIATPLLALSVLWFADLSPGHPEVTRMAAVAILMAGWWITEAIPIPATALLPVALMPLLGIMPGREVAGHYFNHVIFLFVGGFMFALCMQRWNLHRRIALAILLLVGTGPRRIALGFMLSTWLLSMWISNTAATMMVVPMAMAIVAQFRESVGEQQVSRYSVGLLLGIAYAASIGGLATLIGTPPNLAFVRILSIVFPAAPEISFARWFFFALPLSAVFLLIAWLVMGWLYPAGRWRAFHRKGDLPPGVPQVGADGLRGTGRAGPVRPARRAVGLPPGHSGGGVRRPGLDPVPAGTAARR